MCMGKINIKLRIVITLGKGGCDYLGEGGMPIGRDSEGASAISIMRFC